MASPSDLTPPHLTPPGLAIAITRTIHQYWGWFLAEGIVLGLLGFTAILLPALAGITATIFLGWIFLIAGIAGLFGTLRARGAPGFAWSLLSALLALVVGVMLLANPLRGLISITYLLIAYFLFDGVFNIFLALAHRRELSGKWEWMLFNGVIDLVLAGIVVSGLPGTAAWAPGLLVGVDLIFASASLIGMALTARRQITL